MKLLFKIFFVLCLYLSGHAASAQNNKDRVELLRIAFITKRLALTTIEAEKFWPVYNEYNDKIKAIKKNLRQSYQQNNSELSDKEAEELYQLEVRSRQAEFDVHKLYSERIKGLIGAKKMIRLRIAEEDFKREIINSIKERNE